MFPVKSEPSDTFDVGKESQRIRCMDNNPGSGDTLNSGISDNRPDKNLSDDMLLIVAYVKNESISNAPDYNDSSSKRNIDSYGQHFMDINDIKTEKTEACTLHTSGGVTEEEDCTIHVKEESQNNHIKEHDINHMTDISQQDRVSVRDAIDMGDTYPSSATQSKYETQKYIDKKCHSGEKRFKCDVVDYSARSSSHKKRHKLVHSREKL